MDRIDLQKAFAAHENRADDGAVRGETRI